MFLKRVENLLRFGLDLDCNVKKVTFEMHFQSPKGMEICRHYIWQIGSDNLSCQQTHDGVLVTGCRVSGLGESNPSGSTEPVAFEKEQVCK